MDDPIQIELDNDKWRLLKRVRYSHFYLTVPAGFRFDGGSIPNAARGIVGCNFDNLAIRGYLVHDWLYHESRHGRREHGDRKRADNIMRSQHLRDGVSELRADLIYRGVRLGASWYWLTPLEQEQRKIRYDDTYE